MSLTYAISAAATLRTRRDHIRRTGAERRITDYVPSGWRNAGDREAKSREEAYDEKCATDLAYPGPVYVMIWSQSQDWNNPDRVFQLDLPPNGTQDSGRGDGRAVGRYSRLY